MLRYSYKKNTLRTSNDRSIAKELLIEASGIAALPEVETHLFLSASTGSHPHKTRTQQIPSPTRTNQVPAIEIYTAYALDDERFFRKIKEQLDILQRQGWPIACHEHEIIQSTLWQRRNHLATAHLILLLVSPTFLNSDFCYCEQMYAAVERHRTESVCYVIPIILHPLLPLLIEGAPFGKLDFLPTNGKAISTWKDSHLAYRNITGSLVEKIQYIAYYL